MHPSPLHLEHYFFTRISVEAAPHTDKTSPGTLTGRVNCACHKEDPRRWMVTLTVQQKEDSEKKVPSYLVDIEICGFFNVDNSIADNRVEPIVKANGPAVLFGSVREIVALLTGRGPHPAVQLPSVTFIDEPPTLPKPAPKPRAINVSSKECLRPTTKRARIVPNVP